jgi:hypothetical protein
MRHGARLRQPAENRLRTAREPVEGFTRFSGF